MKRSVEELLNSYQIRKSKRQKEKFINWLENHAKEHDYQLWKDFYSNKGTNLIVGDVESAEIILTAHYDTPPNFYLPLVAGINLFSFTISQFLMVIPIILILLIPRWLVYSITQDAVLTSLLINILLFLYLIQMLMGIPNKHNANDNTSGVAVLLSILEDLPAELRGKVCFVFFDEEEKGLLGSFAFKKQYAHTMEEKPLINFDCVANGNTLMFITKKAFRQSKYNNLLENSIEQNVNNSRNSAMGKAATHIYTSDQIIFKNSVGVAAVKKAPVFGYYLNSIHSGLDKKFDNHNIELLSKTMIHFIRNL